MEIVEIEYMPKMGLITCGLVIFFLYCNTQIGIADYFNKTVTQAGLNLESDKGSGTSGGNAKTTELNLAEAIK